MKNIFLFFFLFLNINIAQTQDENLKAYDHVYSENIKSVKFTVGNLQLSYPIIDLNSSAALRLAFDDMDGDVKNYTYTFTHYNADWTPSDIFQLEYLDGYLDDSVDEYDYSFNTIATYTHYDLMIPSDEMKWRISGNYLLKVYNEDDGKKLAITRRFMVVDNKVQVRPNGRNAAAGNKLRTHHNLSFSVLDKNELIKNPRAEIKAAILQNGRWDNAITDVEPFVIKGNEISFDYPSKLNFPAGLEFRYVDLRSFQYENHGIESIEEYEDGYVINLKQEKKRNNQVYLHHLDANGQFVVENIDRPREHDLRSDYADVHFKLYSPQPIHDADVYLFGALTDWQILPEYKMTYQAEMTAYTGMFVLKQGRYDYLYAVLPKGKKQANFEDTENSWFDTNNDYSILIYYRPFGTQYDQLISAYTLDLAKR